MRRHAILQRYPPGEALAGIVDWFWAVAWDLPDGVEHVQQVLTHPGSHLSIGTLDSASRMLDPARGRVYGVRRRLDERRLVGRGWTVAAKTTGGLAVLTDRPAHQLTDSELPLDEALGATGLVGRVVAADDQPARVDLLREALGSVVATRDPRRVAVAREVSAIAALVEVDRGVLRLEQLAASSGVSPRSLQRKFSEHLGVSPAWVIRRWRIVEAADRAAGGEAVSWAELASDLGYSDQAHLVRDFRAHLGITPGAYRRRASA
jgi:AraC-like DNA-binding protein